MSSNTNTFLTPVKTVNFNITEFVGSTLDPCFTKGILESSPVVYKTGNSFYFDYSGSANSADLKFLKHFFGLISPGTTFGLTGGTYYIEDTGDQYGFAGIYTFHGCTGLYNQYLNCSGVTYSPSLVNGVYENTNFVSPPQFTASVGFTAQYFTSKVNKQDPFNLNFFGIYGNDYGYEEYLEISGASLNNGRYLTDTAINLNDESQIIYLNNSAGITNENLYFKPVVATLYMRGVPDLATLSQSSTLNGLLKKVDSNGTTLQIFDNQNLRQKYCRAISDTANYYDWYAGHVSSSFENIFNPISYDSLSLSIDYFSFLKISSIIVYSNYLTDQLQYEETLGLVIDGIQTDFVSYNASPPLPDPVVKIDLSDASLYASTVEPYVDQACSIPLGQSYFLNGIPGFDGASFIYLKTTNMPSVIYLKVTKTVPMVLRITVQN